MFHTSFLFFICWIKFWGVRTFQNFDLKFQIYHNLFIYLFIFKILEIQFTINYENQKQPFTKATKTAADFFFKIHSKTPEQESHKNSYLKHAILLKKRLQHRYITVSFSKFFRTATFNSISWWIFWFHASSRISMLSLTKSSKLNKTTII